MARATKKMIKYFDLVRDTYRGQTTLGTIKCPAGEVFQTLEDTVRGWGIKDKGNTAIPHTADTSGYLISVTFSQRFGRRMTVVTTEKDGFTLKSSGIEFKGIRMHGGNTHLNTEGCIIVAKKRTSNVTVQGTAEAEITKIVEDLVKEGHECRLRILNKSQAE